VFNEGILTDILNGSLKIVIRLTNQSLENSDDTFNFVEGYDFIQHSLWPLLSASLDQHLSFAFSVTPSNLELFPANYRLSQDFTVLLN
jgi:hypothetical protein